MDVDLLHEDELEAEIEKLERELRLLDAAKQQLYQSGASITLVSTDDVEVLLEDLPIERLCLFLPAVSLISLMVVSTLVFKEVESLLAALLLRLRESASSGLPLLLPLLKFFHSLQAPRLTLNGGMELACFLGHSLRQLPAACVGPPGDERWCPLRLRAESAPSFTSQWRGAGVGSANMCAMNLGGHIIPRMLKLELFCSEVEPESPNRRRAPEVVVSLVDTSVPRQPLFSLTLQCPSPECQTLRATVREVVSCQGRGAWAYRQRPWSLQSCCNLQESDVNIKSLWLQLHFEFDWDTSLCAALVESEDRIEGPLQLEWRPEFGATPTANALHIELAPGADVVLSTLLVG